MSTSPISIRLEPDALKILDESTGERGQSGPSRARLLSGLLRHHRRRAVAAFSALQEWSPAELCAAMDALTGVWSWGGPQPYVAAELHDAERLNGTASKWDASENWEARCKDAQSPEVRRALLDLAEAFWSGDQWVARRLDVDS